MTVLSLVYIFFSFYLLSSLLISATEVEKVKLEVYIESGCPVSQAFFVGELSRVLAMPDINSITDFKYVPFGESFYNQTLGKFQCWDEDECQTDAIQLCSLYKLSNDITVINSGANSYTCFPFISCMEANSGKTFY